MTPLYLVRRIFQFQQFSLIAFFWGPQTSLLASKIFPCSLKLIFLAYSVTISSDGARCVSRVLRFFSSTTYLGMSSKKYKYNAIFIIEWRRPKPHVRPCSLKSACSWVSVSAFWRRANVLIFRSRSRTPLYLATLYGEDLMVILLLQHGANPNLICKYGGQILFVGRLPLTFRSVAMSHRCTSLRQRESSNCVSF